MSLRKLTILLIAGTTIIMSGVMLTLITRTLTLHFETQEKNGVYLNLNRVLGAIEQQKTFLENTSNDWANWDDTYQFVEDQNAQYIKDNLQSLTFLGLGVDLIILVDNHFDVAYTGIMNSEGKLLSELPLSIKNHLVANDPILSGPTENAPRSGFMLVNGMPMMVTSHPILKTDKSGPSHGSLIMGKYLNTDFINSISNVLLLSIKNTPYAEIQNDSAYASLFSFKASNNEPYYVSLSPNRVYGYAFLNDLYGQPISVIQVDQIPTIYNNGIVVNEYLVISIVGAALTFSIILFFLIQFNVLNRVSQLGRDVLAIGASGDITGRLPIARKDELSQLAASINDMLRALQNAISSRQESEERFRKLVESMDDVVFTMNRDDKAVQIYEKKRSPAEADSSFNPNAQTALSKAYLEDQLKKSEDLLDRSFKGESTQYEWTTRQNDTISHFIATLSPIYNDQNQIVGVVGVSKDITHQKKLEQDLRKRVDELAGLYYISQKLLNQYDVLEIQKEICQLAIDQLGMEAAWIVLPSPAGSKLVPSASSRINLEGLSEIPLYPGPTQTPHPAASAFADKEMRIAPLAGLIGPNSIFEQTDGKALAAIPLTLGDEVLAVLLLVMKDERSIGDENMDLIRAYTNLSSVAFQNGSLFNQVLMGRERLQAVSKRLVEVQEEERRKIALELHDEIGQILTSLRFTVDLIRNLPAEKIEGQIAAALEMVNDLISRIRQMSLDLRPSMLDDLGIIPTLIWFIDRYTGQTGIRIAFTHSNLAGRRFAANIEIAVYRVVQEALTNAARYAGVSSVTVRLWCNENLLGIQVEDEGVGFDVDRSLASQKSIGLVGMGERIKSLGGQFHVVSELGEGTSVTAEIPLRGYLERRLNER